MACWSDPRGDETTENLVERWIELQSGGHEEVGVPPRDAVERSRSRAARVLAVAGGIEPRRALDGPRAWEAHWDPEGAKVALAAALEKLGWAVVVSPGPVTSPTGMGAASLPAEGDVVVIEGPGLEDQAARFRAAGLELPFGAVEALCYTLCRELFEVAAPRVGKPPKEPWVDALAVHEFTRTVLGWPFTPLALEVIEGSAARE